MSINRDTKQFSVNDILTAFQNYDASPRAKGMAAKFVVKLCGMNQSEIESMRNYSDGRLMQIEGDIYLPLQSTNETIADAQARLMDKIRVIGLHATVRHADIQDTVAHMQCELSAPMANGENEDDAAWRVFDLMHANGLRMMADDRSTESGFLYRIIASSI